MVADRPLLASRPHGDLKTIAVHVDADENLSRHESSAFANCLHWPNLAGCGLAVRPRQLFGLLAGPDWDDQASRRSRADQRSNGLSQPFTFVLSSSWGRHQDTRSAERACERSNDWRRGAQRPRPGYVLDQDARWASRPG